MSREDMTILNKTSDFVGLYVRKEQMDKKKFKKFMEELNKKIVTVANMRTQSNNKGEWYVVYSKRGWKV